MLATMDVVATRHWWQARALLSRLERSAPGRVFAAGFPSMGQDLHTPKTREPKNTFVGNMVRRDGWGNFSDPRRLFVMMAWDDADELERFAVEGPWPEKAQRFHARLRPVRSTGTVGGENPFGEDFTRTRGTDEMPGIVITWAHFPASNVASFLPVLREAVAGAHAAPGGRASFGAVRRNNPLRFKGFTVSLWERLGDAAAYAYRNQNHRYAMDWLKENDKGHESWFGRFVLESYEGTIAGRDPFEGIALPEPEKAQAAEPLAETASS